MHVYGILYELDRDWNDDLSSTFSETLYFHGIFQSIFTRAEGNYRKPHGLLYIFFRNFSWLALSETQKIATEVEDA